MGRQEHPAGQCSGNLGLEKGDGSGKMMFSGWRDGKSLNHRLAEVGQVISSRLLEQGHLEPVPLGLCPWLRTGPRPIVTWIRGEELYPGTLQEGQDTLL